MTAIIDVVRDQFNAATRQARHDWADVTKINQQVAPTYLLDTRDHRRYCRIVGAMAYPSLTPGCLIIAGVQADPPVVRVLEYVEHESIYGLIEIAVKTRQRYGFGASERILDQFLGDESKYLTLIARCSEKLESANGPGRGLYIRYPLDWIEKHAFPLYMRQLRDALKNKLIEINGHTDLLNRLQAFRSRDTEKGKITDYPAPGMMGALAHTMMIERPWLEDIDSGKSYNLDEV